MSPNVRCCCCKAFAAFRVGSRVVTISENKFYCKSNRCSSALETAISWQKSFNESSRWSISQVECQRFTQSKIGFFCFNFFKITIIDGFVKILYTWRALAMSLPKDDFFKASSTTNCRVCAAQRRPQRIGRLVDLTKSNAVEFISNISILKAEESVALHSLPSSE